MEYITHSKFGHIAYLLTALELTLSLSKLVVTLLSWGAEAMSWSDRGTEERTPRLAGCDVPSGFTTPTIPLTAPDLSIMHLRVLEKVVKKNISTWKKNQFSMKSWGDNWLL